MQQPFKKHVFVCTQQKPDWAPSCSASGGEALLGAFRAEVAKAGLASEVAVSGSGCLGLCGRGPNVVVYPEGQWYSEVKPEEVGALVREHLAADRPLKRSADPDAQTIRTEIAAHSAKMRGRLEATAKAGALPEPLAEDLRGFQKARAILTAVELGLFDAVEQGAETAEDAARALGSDARATEMLMNAVAGMGLLEKREERFSNGPWAKAYLVEGAPHDSRQAILHTSHMWHRWHTLTEAVKRGTAVNHRPMEEHGADEWTRPFIAAMHKTTQLRAPQVAAAIGLDGVERLLDLGGGSGGYAIAFARANPKLEATVLDLPAVTPLTREYADATEVGGRIQTVNGNLRTDAYGSGYDLVFISAIAHMNAPDENVEMLKKAHAALNAGGRVVLQDFILRDDKTRPLTGALFALNMLVGTASGSAYSEAEYREWLTEAGFGEIESLGLPGPTGLVVGYKR